MPKGIYNRRGFKREKQPIEKIQMVMESDIQISIPREWAKDIAELLNYGEAAIGHPAIVKSIKDQLIGQLI